MTASTIKATGSVTASSITSTGTLTAANSAFVVDENGSMTAARITVSNLGTMTGGFLSVGTISANATTHGTTTVRFLNDIYANGTVTAAYFTGNGAGITGLTVNGSAITPSSINTSGTLNAGATTVSSLTAGSTTVSTLTTTGSITAGIAGGFKVDTAGSMTATTITTTGSVTASTLAITGNVFKVDSAGSMTATTITSTGSMTVSGTLTAASNSFRADTDAIKITSRLGIGTTTPSSLYLLQVTNDSDTGVVLSSAGSMTAKTLAVTGTATVTGTLTASNDLRVDTNTLVVDATNNRVGIGTTTPATALHVTGTITATAFSGSGSESDIIVMKTSDTANATTTMADATGLSFSALANTDYIIEAWVIYETSATTIGIKLSAAGPTSPTGMFGQWIINTGTAGTPDGASFNADDVGATMAAAAFTTGNLANLWCILRNGVNAGTFTIRFAAESGGTITVKTGSALRYRKIP